MRKISTVGMVLVAGIGLLAGCSTKTTPKATSGSTTGSSVPSAPSPAQGVTSSSIRVGVTYVDFSAIRNVVNIDQGDFRTSYQALVDDINAKGGIDGRKIQLYFAPVNPIGTAPAAQACTQLTEDDHVFVVLGFFNGTDPLCYLDTHGVNIIGGPATGASLSPAQQAAEKGTWFTTTLTPGHLFPKEMDVFEKEGVFKGQKVAVVAAAADQSQMGLVLPELKKLGVDVVQTAINDVSPTDVSAAYREYATIGLKFQSAGATAVVAVGESASQGWPASLQANHSTYLPKLVATEWDSLYAWITGKGGYEPAVLNGAVTALGSEDNVAAWQGAGMARCAALISAAHPSEPVIVPTAANQTKQPATWVSAEQACTNITLLEDILRAAGHNLDNQTFNAGGESLKNVVIPGSGAAGPMTFSAQYHDGNAPIVIYDWNSAKEAFDSHVAS
ncbi:MAG: ABC transporter substrate-binding protein [Actinomycetota bacterium]|nr:ABC transporter substrate-binding protein [Actinomycetota bacterium]